VSLFIHNSVNANNEMKPFCPISNLYGNVNSSIAVKLQVEMSLQYVDGHYYGKA